jgi:hypothetical protein
VPFVSHARRTENIRSAPCVRVCVKSQLGPLLQVAALFKWSRDQQERSAQRFSHRLVSLGLAWRPVHARSSGPAPVFSRVATDESRQGAPGGLRHRDRDRFTSLTSALKAETISY